MNSWGLLTVPVPLLELTVKVPMLAKALPKPMRLGRLPFVRVTVRVPLGLGGSALSCQGCGDSSTKT